jgi:phage terminase large subunit
LYIFTEYSSVKCRNKDVFDTLYEEEKLVRTDELITADSAEPKSISEMNERGLKVIGARKGPDSVDYGISWLQHQSKIIIDPKRTPNAYTEFTAYEYDRDKNGNFISRYPDKNNHAIDSLRYALSNIIGNRKVGAMSKSKLGVY